MISAFLSRISDSMTVESLYEMAVWYTFSLLGLIPVSALVFGIIFRITDNEKLGIYAGMAAFCVLSVILWRFYSHVGRLKQFLPSGLGILRITTVMYSIIAVLVLLAKGMLNVGNLTFVLLCFEGMFLFFLLAYTSFAIRFHSKLPIYEILISVVIFCFSVTHINSIQ